MSGLAIAALVVAAFVVGRPAAPDAVSTRTPPPLQVGLAAFVVTSGYWLSTELPVHGGRGVVVGILGFAAAVVGGALVVERWSHSSGWKAGTGSRLRRVRRRTPPGSAPSQAGEAGTGPIEAAWGAVVFGLATAAVVAASALRQRRLARAAG